MESISKEELSAAVNDGVIQYLEERSLGPGIVHPDVKERMIELIKNLEGMSLRKYKNTLIIKTDDLSTIVAAAYGTAYAIKTGSMFADAINSGAKTCHKWSGGGSLNLAESFGPDWVVGTWEKDEADWIQIGNA